MNSDSTMSINHELRRKSLGASEVAAILGCNDNMSPLDVWLLKTGRKEVFEGNEHTRRGNRQERQILEWLAEDLGGGILGVGCNPFIHHGSIATATPDALFSSIPNSGVRLLRWPDIINGNIEIPPYLDWELFEAKSTLRRIKDKEDLDDSHLIQCQWQMLCTGLKKCHLAIFGPMVSDYQRFEIEYKHDFAMELLQKATDWWEKHVVGDFMPDPVNVSDAQYLWPVDDGSTIEAVPRLYEAISQYSALGDQISTLQKQQKELKNMIVPAIGAAKSVTYCGQRIATYSTVHKSAYSVGPTTYRQLRT